MVGSNHKVVCYRSREDRCGTGRDNKHEEAQKDCKGGKARAADHGVKKASKAGEHGS